MFNTFTSAGFIPTITKPTRITHSSSTLIDNIYIRSKNLDRIQSGIITSYISDHLPIFLLYGTCKAKPKQPVTFTYRKIDELAIQSMKKYLYNIDWKIINTMDIDQASSFLTDNINHALDMFAPERTKVSSEKNRFKQKWMTPDLLKLSKLKEKLYKLSIGKPKDSNESNKFISCRNNYEKLKRITKQDYFKNQLEKYKLDIRKTWSVLNTIIGRNNKKSKLSDDFDIDGDKIDDPDKISNEFCKYFTEIGNKFASKIPKPRTPFHNHLTNKVTQNIFMFPTNPKEILKLIYKMKPKKSAGPDNISSQLVKQLASSIKQPISEIINKSLQTGKIPKAWKLAKIVPIYKSKQKNLMCNYRPISLLPTLSKVLEKVVHNRLYTFCMKQNVLYENQFGFRKGHSTEHAILNFVAKVVNAMDNKKLTMAIFLDLSKAFDTIDHNILLAKLHHYGIRGLALEWFRNYLNDRTQYVSYKDSKSELMNLTCGVPQGSVLGPLLFIIYTNDLPNCLAESNCILFADDTTVFRSSSNADYLASSIQNDLKSLYDWFCANKLSLNIGKTNFLLFSPSTKNKYPHITELKLGNQSIQRLSSAKFLGLCVDEELKWDEHLNQVYCRLSSGSYAIRTAKRNINKHNLTCLYYSLVQSHLTYGITLWGSALKTKLRKLEVSQNKSIRHICNGKYNAPCTPMYLDLKIPKLADLYEMQLAKLMYLHSKASLPPPLQRLFTLNENIHNHNTRTSRNPHVFTRSTLVLKTFLGRCPKIWSDLPGNITNMKSIKSFSTKLKTNIIAKYKN